MVCVAPIATRAVGHDVSFVVEEPTGVRVHGLHERAHVLGIHVGVQPVAEIGDVAPGAERLHHRLYDLRNVLLNTHRFIFIFEDSSLTLHHNSII